MSPRTRSFAAPRSFGSRRSAVRIRPPRFAASERRWLRCRSRAVLEHCPAPAPCQRRSAACEIAAGKPAPIRCLQGLCGGAARHSPPRCTKRVHPRRARPVRGPVSLHAPPFRRGAVCAARGHLAGTKRTTPPPAAIQVRGRKQTPRTCASRARVPCAVQPRDFAIVRDVWRYKFLTVAQIGEQRERAADEREGATEERERARLRRVEERLRRTEARHERERAGGRRENAEVQREIAASDREARESEAPEADPALNRRLTRTRRQDRPCTNKRLRCRFGDGPGAVRLVRVGGAYPPAQGPCRLGGLVYLPPPAFWRPSWLASRFAFREVDSRGPASCSWSSSSRSRPFVSIPGLGRLRVVR